MDFREALFFVARSLTISNNENNRKWVINKLKDNSICWEMIVKVSTSHYVLPALYCSLEKNKLLHLIHEDFVNYSAYLTELNRVRNEEILEQTQELNTLLIKNGVTPIFIKGTGFILQELYGNISERMISDIDFLVSKKDALRAYIILINNGYNKRNNNNKTILSDFSHLPRLVKNDGIAAVKIHHELIIKKHRKKFSCNNVSKDVITTSNKLNFLSYENQVSLTIISPQINNSESIYMKKIQLRNSYDLYLLSKKVDTLKAIKHFKKLFLPLNDYLAISQYVFNDTSIKAKSRKRCIELFNKNFLEPKNANIRKKILLFKLSFIDTGLRKTLLKRIARKSWRTQKLLEFGLRSKK